MNNTKWCNGFYIEFRQSFAKETFPYDEHLNIEKRLILETFINCARWAHHTLLLPDSVIVAIL